MKQTREDLVGHLREQLGFLETSGAAFDAGQIAEAKRLATAIRILVHDTTASTSLLQQLGVKDDLQFVDTSHPPFPFDLEPGVLTVRADFGLAVGTIGAVSPYGAIHEDRGRREPKPFSEWWTTPVLNDHIGNKFARRELVLGLAHMDGGAHVDPELEEAYAALSRDNSLGWTFYRNEERLPDTSPVPANVRQIAYELQRTIEEQLGDLIQADKAAPASEAPKVKLDFGSLEVPRPPDSE